MRQVIRGFIPVLELCGLTDEVAEFQRITSRHEGFEKRSRLPADPKVLAAWDSAVLELATGKGSIQKAVNASVAAPT